MLHRGRWPGKSSRQFLTDVSSTRHSRDTAELSHVKDQQTGKRDIATYFSQNHIHYMSPLWGHLAWLNLSTALRGCKGLELRGRLKSSQPVPLQASCLQALHVSRTHGQLLITLICLIWNSFLGSCKSVTFSWFISNSFLESTAGRPRAAFHLPSKSSRA